MRRARGWQEPAFQFAARRQARRDAPAPGVGGLPAVEADAADARVLREEFREIVDADRALDDRGVEAPRPAAARDHVPERDTRCEEAAPAARVGRARIEAEEL